MNVTVIIPVFKLCDHRFHNFKHIIGYLHKYNIPSIVVEQTDSNNETNVQTYLLSLNASNIQYQALVINDNQIHKSTLINYGSDLVNSKYMWMLDCDCYLRYQAITAAIEDQDVIQPFSYVIFLSKEESNMFTEHGQLFLNGGRRKIARHFGPLSFIIKKEAFNTIGKMNEDFIGYGWEDIEFASRVKLRYPITQLEYSGLHLYHDRPTETNNNNKALYLQLVSQRTSLDKHTVNINTALKSAFVNSRSSAGVQCKRIIHIISPALVQTKPSLYNRELLAIQSVTEQKQKCGINVDTILFTSNILAEQFKDNFKIIKPYRTALDIGDTRDICYLSDIFQTMADMADDNTIMLYTNSDCCLKDGTYETLLKYDKHAVEYHRNNVLNDPQTLKEVFNNPVTIHTLGIDGLAVTKQFYDINNRYIADFFVGEPHWDTAVGGFLRQFNLSTLNTIHLYHPNHNITWDTKNLTVAGKHNTRLYREFLDYELLKSRTLSLPNYYANIDTSVVIVHYGDNPLRIKTVKENLKWLEIQELPVETVFVELINKQSNFTEELANKRNCKHIILKRSNYNDTIWQKEAMMNIGAKSTTGKYVIFLDSDIHSIHSNWFTQIREKLMASPKTFLQVFKTCQDTKLSADQAFVSLAAKKNGVDIDLPHNPGLGIAVCKNTLISNNYFNPYCLYGGGDSCIIGEYCNNDSFIFTFPKINKIRRSVQIICKLDYINEDIIHINHGEMVSLDYYRTRHEITKKFTKDIKELLDTDHNGLLVWRNPNCVEKKLIDKLYKTKFK